MITLGQFRARHAGWSALAVAALLWLAAGAGDCPRVAGQELAAAPADSFMERQLETRGDITLRDVPLSQALLMIGREWSVNVVGGRDVSGTVTADFRDATLREVLEALLISNGYGYRASGRSLIIMRLDELGKPGHLFRSVTIPLPVADPQDALEVADAARSLLSPHGTIQPIPSARSLLVVDFPEHVQRVAQLLAGLRTTGDDPAGLGTTEAPQAGYFRPQFIRAVSLEETIRMALGSDLAQVTVLPEENAIVVIDTPSRLRIVEQIVQQLDVPRPQVRITALIYDISLEEMERLGVNWAHALKGRFDAEGEPRSVFGFDSGLVPLPTAGAEGGGTEGEMAIPTPIEGVHSGMMMLTGTARRLDLHTMIRALDETRGARLLADPTVLVRDREDAEFKIITKIPVQQLTQTQEGGSIGTTTFEEAGVTLRVRAEIASDGTVLLDVTPAFSRLAGFQQGQPIIDSREARTVVRVGHRETIIIGGLRQRSETETVRGVPGLMHNKWLGRLFRDHDANIRESELLVFIRPEIIDWPVNRPREAAAVAATTRALDRIPAGHDGPFVPDCRDPWCPYHHPRPRIHGETVLHDPLCDSLHDSPHVPPGHVLPPEPLLHPPPDPAPWRDGRGPSSDGTPAPLATLNRLPPVDRDPFDAAGAVQPAAFRLPSPTERHPVR